MADAPARKSHARLSRLSSRASAARGASFLRRLKIAGIDIDHEEVPDDIHEFRRRMTRKISMFINTWHGCPQLLCRRNRGCMAPENVCSNVRRKKRSPEEAERAWCEVQPRVQQALKDCLAKRRPEDT